MRISPSEACQRLLRDQVVAIPTETVYGLAASLSSPKAIARVFEIKRRPSNNPLIIHLADAQQLARYVQQMPPGALEMADRFWPGSLTLVLPVDVDLIPLQVRAGLSAAAFRVPNHPVALEILRQVGPIVAPSANISGRPSSTCPEHVEEDFGDTLSVVDGGHCTAGLESTILVFDKGHWYIARLGALPAESFQSVLGYAPAEYTSAQDQATPLCPGRLHRHYAPQAKLVLSTQTYDAQRPVVLGYSDRDYPGATKVVYLGVSTEPEQIMHELYETLRQLDRIGLDSVWVDMNIPADGLWKSIRERLLRAAEN